MGSYLAVLWCDEFVGEGHACDEAWKQQNSVGAASAAKEGWIFSRLKPLPQFY